MKHRLLAMAVAAMLLPATPVNAASDHAYLQPDLEVGEQLIHVFSKATSIKGDGFKEVVGRTSGTAHITVKTIGPDAIVTHDMYRYDGHPVGIGMGKRLADGVTELEYLPRGKLLPALATLRARMTPQGSMPIMITCKSLEPKVLIERDWHAERYSADEFRDAFA